jgi:hypothetical protein
MQKLRLSLEALRVESFATDANSLWRGTVQGRSALTDTRNCECTYITICSAETDDTCDQHTCAPSCGYGICPQTPDTYCEV